MRHGRRDVTHGPIRSKLRSLGASVADTADLGNGYPDMLVGFCGVNFLVEVKAPKEGKLSDGQSAFARDWRGSKPVVLRTPEAAERWYLETRAKLTRP